MSKSKDDTILPVNAPKYIPRKRLTRKFFCAELGEVDLDKLHPAKAEKLIKAGYIAKSHPNL